MTLIDLLPPATTAMPDSDRADHKRLQMLVHPYARYGYAVTLHNAEADDGDIDDDEVRKCLVEAIEEGLNSFRMQTDDNPERIEEPMVYRPIPFENLERNPNLIQGSLADLGKYLYPTVLTTDQDVRKTFSSATDIIGLLRDGKPFDLPYELKRSFMPTVSKINNGSASQRVPRGTLFEAACAVVTTVTPHKPASWIEQRNTIVIPDLESISELVDFVSVFNALRIQKGEDKSALVAKPSKAKDQTGEIKPPSKNGKSSKEPSKPKYRRPPIFRGNYPGAPIDAEYFGAAGVLAAIGYWGAHSENITWAARVLDSVANRPLYVISYDAIAQAQFGHHAVGLAKSGQLYSVIQALSMTTLVGGSELESGRPDFRSTNRKLFKLMASRFIQLFSEPAFKDFLAFRAEYPADIQPLLEEYFMNTNNVDPELKAIVDSAAAYGGWLNYSAYIAARADADDKNNKDKIRKGKAKNITVIESSVMSARSPFALTSQITTQAGRMRQGATLEGESQAGDVPLEAKRFIDAINTSELSLQDSKQLLLSYLRLRTSPIAVGPTHSEADTSTDIDGGTDFEQEEIS